MEKKIINRIVVCIILLVSVILGFIILPPVFRELHSISKEVNKDKIPKEDVLNVKEEIVKNNEAKDTSNFRTEEDGTLVNTSNRIYSLHEASYFQVNEMKIRTLKDEPEMAEIEARITNNSDLVISNTGVYLTFSFSDGTKSIALPLEAKYIPVGGTITAKMKVLNRIIDAEDYSFIVQSFNGGGAG